MQTSSTIKQDLCTYCNFSLQISVPKPTTTPDTVANETIVISDTESLDSPIAKRSRADDTLPLSSSTIEIENVMPNVNLSCTQGPMEYRPPTEATEPQCMAALERSSPLIMRYDDGHVATSTDGCLAPSQYSKPGKGECSDIQRGFSPRPTYSHAMCQDILEIFPQYSRQQVESLLAVLDDHHLTSELLAEGLTLISLFEAWRSRLNTLHPPYLVTTIYATEGDELKCALSYYKKMGNSSADAEEMMSIPFEVSYGKAIDDGGPKAQFFAKVTESLLTESKFAMFEETQSQDYLPTVNQESLLGGLYETLGRVIVHSILYNCPGFPYLSKAAYLYMITMSIDETVPFVTTEDLPLYTHSVLSKVCVQFIPF